MPRWEPELWGRKPTGDEEDCLTALHKIVADERKKLESAKNQYEGRPEIQRQREHEEAAAEAKQQVDDKQYYTGSSILGGIQTNFL